LEHEGGNLPVPPLGWQAPGVSRHEGYLQKRAGKIALTVIAGSYLLVQLAGMFGVMIMLYLGWGMPYDPPRPPWPVFLIWVPGYILQAGLVGVAMWLLWRRPKPP
jgi:hypothetical protein